MPSTHPRGQKRTVREYPNYTTKSFEFLSESNMYGKDIRNDEEAVKNTI